MPLAKLQPEHVARMLADLTARRTLSPSTVRYAYAVLRIALGRALKTGKVVRNVATLVVPPAAIRPKLVPLTADQVRTFLATLDGDRQAPLYTVAIGTGLRQGELLGLRWPDVDLDGATLTVRHQLQRTGGWWSPRPSRHAAACGSVPRLSRCSVSSGAGSSRSAWQLARDGPTTAGTTADVYAHLTSAMSARAAERMDTILRRQAL